MAVLLAAVLIHAAARVARRLIAQVQRVMFGAVLEFQRFGLERGVFFPVSALAAAGTEILHRNAHRNARAAVIAVRPVRESAAAAEARLDELAVDRSVDEVARSCALGARQAGR